jgi:hypothetical protein
MKRNETANESNFMWRCRQSGGEEEKQKKEQKGGKRNIKYLTRLP